MAKKIYGLSAADKKLVKEMIARSVGGFKRRRPTNKRRRFAGGGSDDATIRGAMAAIFYECAGTAPDGIGGGTNPAFLVAITKAGANVDSRAPARLLTWDTTEFGKLIVDSSLGYSEDGGGWVDVVNLTGTTLVGTKTEPLICMGYYAEVTFSTVAAKLFIVADKDFRGMPNFDKIRNQVPYHEADKFDFKLDGHTCGDEP